MVARLSQGRRQGERVSERGLSLSFFSPVFGSCAVLCCEVKNGTESEDLSFGLIRVWAYFLASGD